METTSNPSAAVPARFVLGEPAPYPASPPNAEDWERIRRSSRASRAFAWRIVRDVVSSVELAAEVGDQTYSFQVPRFATWLDSRDVDRLAFSALSAMTRDEVASGAPVTDAAWAQAVQQESVRVWTMPHWDAARLNQWVASLSSPDMVAGLMGLARTIYSPASARELIRQYDTVAGCQQIAVDTDPANTDVFAPCLPSGHAPASVVVKTKWTRLGYDIKVPVHQTNANALAERLAAEDWGAPDRELDPSAEDIFTMKTQSGAVYRLSGMHIMSKEVEDWVWISLWWSDDPSSDFGADRPGDIPAPFDRYKMCVVTGFEGPEEIVHHQDDLQSALLQAHELTDGESWCSNPHFETGPSNQTSNCIGCHQYAGLPLEPEDMLVEPDVYSAGLRQKQRQNFPADYLWSMTKAPEHIAHLIHMRREQVLQH